MDVQAELRTPASPAAVFAWLDDLALYPQWMALVHSAEPRPPQGDEAAAWHVELRGRIGPLTRSKRLRMVRTIHEPDRRVRFERAELDGRAHSPWVLDAELVPQGGDTVMTIQLHYGGSLWTGGVLERALADDIRRGRERLAALVSGSPTR